jgi:hypothetical protein
MRSGCRLYSRESTPLFLRDRSLRRLRDQSEHCVGTNILASVYNRNTNNWISELQLRHYIVIYFLFMTLLIDFGSWPFLAGLRDHTNWTHNTWYDSSGRVISSTQRPLTEIPHTTFTKEKHACPRRDSNPQSQQTRGRPATPSILRNVRCNLTFAF